MALYGTCEEFVIIYIHSKRFWITKTYLQLDYKVQCLKAQENLNFKKLYMASIF